MKTNVFPSISNRILLCIALASFSASAQELLVRPYIQPGNSPTLAKEQKVIIWQTDSVPGTFKVEFVHGTTLEGAAKVNQARISVQPLVFFGKTTLLYRAALTGLEFDAEYTYRVSVGERVMGKATFATRTKKPMTHFVVFGDVGAASPQQAAIAYQVYQQKPQFAVITGDLAYNNGLEREFRARFFPANSFPEPSPTRGAPLVQSIPFYMLVGNHDIYGSDLQKFPDGLAYFYYADVPLNAPTTQNTIEVTGPSDRVKAFKKATDGRFPQITNYSFDYGNVHFTILDGNTYTNPLDPMLVEWMKRDIGSSKADWKIVSFHAPGFHTSKAHYDYQQMRLLSPLFETLGVDMVINGHVHNYQRSKPLKFEPAMNETRDQYLITKEGRVNGKFTLDETFDGINNTKAKGIIYIVTGAGGGGLYDPSFSDKPELWTHEGPENWVPFTVKFVSDIHSFTLIDTNGKTLTLKQIKADGTVFDEIKMTK